MRLSRSKLFMVLGIMVLMTLIFAGCTPNEEKKIGKIDLNRVIQESPKAQQYQQQLDERGAEIQDKYKAISDEELSDEEKLEMQKEAAQEFVQAKKELEDQLNAEIEKAIKQISDEKNLSIVLVKQTVQYGGIDVTQEVINLLK